MADEINKEIIARLLEIVDGIESGGISLDNAEDAREVLVKVSRVMPLSIYLTFIFDIFKPAEEMDPKSATFGFVLGVQTTLRNLEWAQAFDQRYKKENNRSEETATVTADKMVQMIPMVAETEPGVDDQ